MKDWGKKYVQTNVYCPTTIKNRCIVMEECARNMANEWNGEAVTQDDYREPMSKMGELGKSAIENIRKQKKRKVIKQHNQDTDKSHKLFNTQEEAIEYAFSKLGIQFEKRETNLAPHVLRVNGRNPSNIDLLKRMWGISEDNRARMVPITHKTKKWCVYWRPSLVAK